MCFRCLSNDSAPTPFMMSVFADMDAKLGANATGANIVDATFGFFEKAGSPPGATVPGHLGQVAVTTLIRTAKRSGVVINSPDCPPEQARRVLRACAEGLLAAPALAA